MWCWSRVPVTRCCELGSTPSSHKGHRVLSLVECIVSSSSVAMSVTAQQDYMLHKETVKWCEGGGEAKGSDRDLRRTPEIEVYTNCIYMTRK